ncbi:MAG TPA: NAD(P)-binding protein [Bacteroidales bacterium]|nr:NAD(P)-binding protein [Bacteroidales bacterium]
MKKYDLIIAGGGAAGLSLAFYLSRSVLNKLQVLIIDKDRKDKNYRTWGF